MTNPSTVESIARAVREASPDVLIALRALLAEQPDQLAALPDDVQVLLKGATTDGTRMDPSALDEVSAWSVRAREGLSKNAGSHENRARLATELLLLVERHAKAPAVMESIAESIVTLARDLGRRIDHLLPITQLVLHPLMTPRALATLAAEPNVADDVIDLGRLRGEWKAAFLQATLEALPAKTGPAELRLMTLLVQQNAVTASDHRVLALLTTTNTTQPAALRALTQAVMDRVEPAGEMRAQQLAAVAHVLQHSLTNRDTDASLLFWQLAKGALTTSERESLCAAAMGATGTAIRDVAPRNRRRLMHVTFQPNGYQDDVVRAVRESDGLTGLVLDLCHDQPTLRLGMMRFLKQTREERLAAIRAVMEDAQRADQATNVTVASAFGESATSADRHRAMEAIQDRADAQNALSRGVVYLGDPTLLLELTSEERRRLHLDTFEWMLGSLERSTRLATRSDAAAQAPPPSSPESAAAVEGVPVPAPTPSAKTSRKTTTSRRTS